MHGPGEENERDEEEDDVTESRDLHGIGSGKRWLIERVTLVVRVARVRMSPGAGPLSVHSPAGRLTAERARALLYVE